MFLYKNYKNIKYLYCREAPIYYLTDESDENDNSTAFNSIDGKKWYIIFSKQPRNALNYVIPFKNFCEDEWQIKW